MDIVVGLVVIGGLCTIWGISLGRGMERRASKSAPAAILSPWYREYFAEGTFDRPGFYALGKVLEKTEQDHWNVSAVRAIASSTANLPDSAEEIAPFVSALELEDVAEMEADAVKLTCTSLLNKILA